jgi:arginyl-tRNA synthetase
VAQSITDNILENSVADRIEVAGNGMLNIFLKNEWMEQQIASIVSSN